MINYQIFNFESTWNAIVVKTGFESGFLVQYKPGTCLEAEYEGFDYTIFQSPTR